VVLESSRSFPQLPWEASIWYNGPAFRGGEGEWEALDLERSESHPTVLSEGAMHHPFRYTFTKTLPTPFPDRHKSYKGRRIFFTVRYRTDPHSPWQWVNSQFGTPDGEIILQPPIDPLYLGPFPLNLDPGWNIRKLSSEAPDAQLYLVESTEAIPRTEGSNAKMETKLLQRSRPSFNRFFALVRIWSPWLAPRHGEGHFNITEDAILCSFLQHDGKHLVLLAINGVDDVLTVFKSDEAGRIVVAARNDGSQPGKYRILAATAWDFEVANAAVMYEARKIVRQSAAVQEIADHLPKHIKAESVDSDTVLVSNSSNGSKDDSAPAPQWLESWYDSLAYCTWNSLGQALTQEKILSGLDSLVANNIHISTLIIDDNWQSLDGYQNSTSQFQRGWKEFEATSDCFPSGLKAGIATIRDKHPQIRDIAVWHALLGYWGGISPNGSLAKTYKTIEVEKQPGVAGGTMFAIDPSDAHRMFDDFYSFLSSCGITSVKTDAQFFLDLLASTPDRAAFTTTYQSAWTQAHLRHLSGKAISCMSQIPQILFHSFLPTFTPRILLRNSDDFFPDIPASHPWHVFCNAHNALLVQHLNVLPDWDMFQTSHPYSGFHAAARCVSGGPIYITDTPGEHDVKLIEEMVATNLSGQSVILRPSNVGKTMGVYDNYNDGAVLKVGTWHGASGTGTGILGIFNVAEREVASLISVLDFPGVEAQGAGMGGKSWIIRAHVARLITKPITPELPVRPEMLIATTLAARGYDILSAYPVHKRVLGEEEISVAVLGLLGKMTGACAIISSDIHITENGKRLRMDVSLKALGVLGIWMSDLKGKGGRSVDENVMVMILGKAVPRERVGIKDVDLPDGEEKGTAAVLEIDVEGAWKDMELDAGWSNEVRVEVFVN
jgi:hypothetical protein